MVAEAFQKAYDAFREAMVANLKKQASQLISNKVRGMLTKQSSSRPQFITNYEDFIFGSAHNASMVFVNDLFKSAAGGAASSRTQNSLKVAQSAVKNEISPSAPRATIDDYVSGGTDNLFDTTKGGGNAAIMASVANPYNNVFGAYVMASMATSARASQVAKVAETEAVAGGGFLSKVDSSTNLISLPGSTLRDMVSMSETLPMRMVATATSIAEVATNMAAEIVSQAIETGIAQVSEQNDSEAIQANISQGGGETSDTQSDIYEGIKFE